jgi:hypothetical protein
MRITLKTKLCMHLELDSLYPCCYSDPFLGYQDQQDKWRLDSQCCRHFSEKYYSRETNALLELFEFNLINEKEVFVKILQESYVMNFYSLLQFQ